MKNLAGLTPGMGTMLLTLVFVAASCGGGAIEPSGTSRAGTEAASAPTTSQGASSTMAGPTTTTVVPVTGDLATGWVQVASDIGFIAEDNPGSGLAALGDTAAWHSNDGISWVEASITLPTEGDPPPGIDHLVGGPAGFLATAAGHGGVIIWHSDDGLAWQDTSSIPAGSYVPAIAAGDGGFVVFVTAADCSAGAWLSVDGVVWTPRDYPGDCPVVGAAWMGDAYVTVSSAETDVGVITTSQDGHTWSRVGVTQAPAHLDAHIGVLQAEGAGRWVLLGYESDVRPTVPAVAVSTDRGVTWEPGTITGLPDQPIGQYQLRELIHTTRGFFAVGDLETLTDESPGFLLYSVDGETWRHFLLEQAFTDIELMGDTILGFNGDVWAWRADGY